MKKKKPQDATLRNVRAAKKREVRLENKITLLTAIVENHIKRITHLEMAFVDWRKKIKK